MKKSLFFSALLLTLLLLSSLYQSPLYADIQSQIASLEQQRGALLRQRSAIVQQLATLGVTAPDAPTEADVTTDKDGDGGKTPPKEEIYTGKKPDINEIDDPWQPPKEPRMTDDIQRMMDNMEIGPDGKPRVRLDDVLDFQSDTQKMRDLKNASPELREAFNRTLREKVYDPHDQKLIDYILKQPGNEHLTADDIEIDDFRTPKEGQTKADLARDINTDRDYRVLVKVKDKNGNWIEVDTSVWEDQSKMILSESSGFQPPKAWADMTSAERKAARDTHQEAFVQPENWKKMTPEEQINAVKKHQEAFEPPIGWDKMTGAERMRAIDEHAAKLQQMQTDAKHAEACRDYSDQGVDPKTGKRIQLKEPNILKVKRGEATLLDAPATGQMYRNKVNAALSDGNKPEAIAQSKKAVDTLTHVREGYAMQGYDVGQLPQNLQDAMAVLKSAHTDTRANSAEVEQKLKDLGFEGGIEEVSNKMASEIAALGDARQTPAAVVRAGVDKFKKGAEAHGEAKKVTEVAVKLADGAYAAHTWNQEAAARETANAQVTRRNQRVDTFYTQYDSDAEFRRGVDERVKAGSLRLPNREPMKPMEEAGIGEKLGLESVKKDGLRIVTNVLDDIDSINSVLQLTKHAAGREGLLGQMARSEALANVKGGLGTTAQVAGNVASLVNTTRNVFEAGTQYNKMNDALEGEQKAVDQANVTLNRYQQTQQRVQSEVADEHGGNWREYVASKRPDFQDMTPIQQAELVIKIQESATKKIETAEYVGWTTDDIDYLGSVDAALTNAPVVGGVYTSGKNITKLGSEAVQLNQAWNNEEEAAGRAGYTEQRVSNADNIEAQRLQQAATNYRERIANIKSGTEKERGLTVKQLESRLSDIETRLAEEE